MKSNFLSLGKSIAFAIVGLLLFGLGIIPFSKSLTAQAEAVPGITATPHNGAAMISWNAPSNAASITAYEVSYGLYSVAEGLASTYDQIVNTGSIETNYSLHDLNNGFRYYVAVRALSGEQSSEYSEEIMVTPSSIYSALPETEAVKAAAGENEETAAAPTVQSAMALTTTVIKVEFSEDIELPEILPELSFSIAENDDPSALITVEKAEYKVDYAGESNEDVHENIVFVTLSEDTKVETEYSVTVSAAVTDTEGNPIESGVTDFAVFASTDRTEIPEQERPLVAGEVVPTESAPDPTPLPENTPDITAPENVTNFAISAKEQGAGFWLDLTWEKSTSEDINDQKLYESKNGGDFGTAVSLGKDAESHGLTGTPETELSYKLTALDAAGNESSGTIASIRLPALASTGAPFALLALGASLALSGLKKYRK